MKEYRIDISIRNNLILDRMRERGIKHAAELSRLSGVHPSTVGDYINLKAKPLRDDGSYSENIQKIADALGCAPEDLFTEEQIRMALRTNKTHLEMTAAEIRFLIDNRPKSPEDAYLETERGRALTKALNELTPRERAIISGRFGLDGAAKTLVEIGQEQNVTPARIRQLESRAIVRLRNRLIAGGKLDV